MAKGKIEVGMMLCLHIKVLEENDGQDCVTSCLEGIVTEEVVTLQAYLSECIKIIVEQHNFTMVRASVNTVSEAAIKLATQAMSKPEQETAH